MNQSYKQLCRVDPVEDIKDGKNKGWFRVRYYHRLPCTPDGEHAGVQFYETCSYQQAQSFYHDAVKRMNDSEGTQ